LVKEEISKTMIKRGFVVHFELTNVNTNVVRANRAIPKESKNPRLSHCRGYDRRVFVKNV
jgi:hypothetical protein